MSEAYHHIHGDQIRRDWSETYDMLVGPDGFECLLTELEDRTWSRDGKSAIRRLNEQHAEIERLRAEVKSLRGDRDERAKQKGEMFAEVERLRAENATLLESGGKAEYQVGERSDCRPDERDMV